ncbi:MAG: oxalate:formate antiporter [Candidatus Hydrothermarchaeota archaeon]|nr:MAG: oxalate:formate antiporter [Candidatus Hydrothermarchaeota archaeon]
MTNRWLVVFAGFLLNLMLGIVYAWSVFVRPLMGEFGWTKTTTMLAFSIFLMVFAILMVPAGRAQDRMGPRKVAMVGGVLLGLGFILASFVTSIKSPYWLYLTYGVVAGAGCGLGYACPIPAARKWFPDRPGLAVGLVVMGFGMSALLFAPLERMLLDMYGIQKTFFIIGCILLIVAVFAASLLRNPPEGWLPEGYNPATTQQTANVISGKDIEPMDMIKTKQFWMLWISFVFMASAGLMVIGHIAAYARELGIEKMAAALAASVLSVFNAMGRPGSGALSDKIGRAKTMFILFLIQGCIMIIFPKFAVTLMTIYIAVAIIGFNFGANFALFPSATADFFGTKNLGVNYGLVFTAYGVGGLLGPIMGARVYDATQSYTIAFTVAGILALIASGLSFALKPPKNS